MSQLIGHLAPPFSAGVWSGKRAVLFWSRMFFRFFDTCLPWFAFWLKNGIFISHDGKSNEALTFLAETQILAGLEVMLILLDICKHFYQLLLSEGYILFILSVRECEIKCKIFPEETWKRIKNHFCTSLYKSLFPKNTLAWVMFAGSVLICFIPWQGLKTLQISQILFFLACGKYLPFRELPNRMRKCRFRKIAPHRSRFWHQFSLSLSPIFGWGWGYWFMSNIMKDWHLPEYNGD